MSIGGVYGIRSSRVLLPDGLAPATIYIDGGAITRVVRDPPAGAGRDVSTDSPAAADHRLHDVGSPLIMPGVVDTHVHVNDPGRSEWEGFETATAAAAAGGVTTIVDMPLNSIPATTTVAALEQKRRAAAGRALVDVCYWGGVVPGNAAEIAPLAAAGVRGFKCFLAPSGVDEFRAVGEDDLRAALPSIARSGLPLLVHAEWPAALCPIDPTADRRRHATWLASRPEIAEARAIERLIALAREFAVRVHIVHLAAAAALPGLRAARAEGLPITVETCPHYLTFAAEEIADGDTAFKCAPPIRDAANRERLWQALANGDIDLIASDHSPCPAALKPRGDFAAAWGGIASLELALPVVWTGARARGYALPEVARWMSAAPAALAGLSAKGSIRPGADADFVVWDPEAAFEVRTDALVQRHKQTPYLGRQLYGRVLETWVRGSVVYRGQTS